MSRVEIDAELLRQLEAAAAQHTPVGVVVSLQPGPSRTAIPAEEVEPVVRGVLKRVGEEIGAAPGQVQIFRNLGAFALSAPAPFVRKLLDQEEIASATANRQSEDLLIHPVSSKEVKRPIPRRRKRK
jgi:hypothetical protein